MTRRLTRDTKGAVLGGVAAGFADYFDVDPVLVRVIFILLAVLSGFGVIAYIVGWVIMPRQGESAPADRLVESVRQAGERVAEEVQKIPDGTGRGRATAGIILIVLGALFLIERLDLWRWPHWARIVNFWPAILILIGVSLVLQGARRRQGKAS
jgi:phage shock protein C